MKTISSLLSLVVMAAVLAVAPATFAASDNSQEQISGQKTPSATCSSAPSCPMKNPRCIRCLMSVLLVVMAIVHISLAVWVYGDVQKRGVAGRGIFIILALLAGIPATILYALVRIGDRCGEKP